VVLGGSAFSYGHPCKGHSTRKFLESDLPFCLSSVFPHFQSFFSHNPVNQNRPVIDPLSWRGYRDTPKRNLPWRQPRGKWIIYLVNFHTNATSKRWHLWEIDLRFALNSTPGWNRWPFDPNSIETLRMETRLCGKKEDGSSKADSLLNSVIYRYFDISFKRLGHFECQTPQLPTSKRRLITPTISRPPLTSLRVTCCSHIPASLLFFFITLGLELSDTKVHEP